MDGITYWKLPQHQTLMKLVCAAVGDLSRHSRRYQGYASASTVTMHKLLNLVHALVSHNSSFTFFLSPELELIFKVLLYFI